MQIQNILGDEFTMILVFVGLIAFKPFQTFEKAIHDTIMKGLKPNTCFDGFLYLFWDVRHVLIFWKGRLDTFLFF